MLETIVQFVFGGSLIGMGVIALRKAPVLTQIPEEEIERLDFKKPLIKIGRKIKSFKIFSSSFLLQKILSKVKVLTLIIERKAENKLRNLRETEKRKKDIENDNYWERLKEVKKRDK